MLQDKDLDTFDLYMQHVDHTQNLLRIPVYILVELLCIQLDMNNSVDYQQRDRHYLVHKGMVYMDSVVSLLYR